MLKNFIFLAASLTVAGLVAAAEPTGNDPAGARREKLVDDIEQHGSGKSGQPPMPVHAIISRSEALLKQGGKRQIKQALHLMEFALKFSPGELSVHVGLARAEAARYSRRWDEDDAVVDRVMRHARMAMEIAPDRSESHAVLAIAFVLAGDWSDAFEEARRAWVMGRFSSPSWVTQIYAQTLIGQARVDEALEIIDEALRRQPDLPSLYAMKGTALIEAGDRVGAIAELENALLLDDGLIPARILLGRVHDLMGNRTLAGKILEDVVNRAPEEKGRVFTLMAVTLISRQKYAKALIGLNQIEFKTSLGLGQGTVLYLKGAAHEGLGDKDEAGKAYRRVIDEFPRASYGSYAGINLASSSYEALARLEMKAGRMDDAARIMEEAMAGPRPNLTLFLRLALLYEHYNLLEEALNILKRAAPVDFGPRQVGPKVTLYVAWARASRKLAGNSRNHRDTELLNALAEHEEALLASENLSHFLEAARAAAVAGDAKTGLTWVQRAFELGYVKLGWIAGDPEMRIIAELAGYKELVSRTTAP